MYIYNLKKAKILDEGKNGICYEVEGNKVLKLFKVLKSKEEVERYKMLREFRNSSVIFPDEFITSFFYFKGYISEKAPGRPIDASFLNCEIGTLLTSLVPLQKDMDYLSENSVLMDDLHPRNVLFDGKKLSVIDIDGYQIFYGDKDRVRDQNYKRMCAMFYNMLVQYMSEEIDRDISMEITSLFRKCLLYDFDVDDMIAYCDQIFASYAGQREPTFGEYIRVLKKGNK